MCIERERERKGKGERVSVCEKENVLFCVCVCVCALACLCRRLKIIHYLFLKNAFSPLCKIPGQMSSSTCEILLEGFRAAPRAGSTNTASEQDSRRRNSGVKQASDRIQKG